MPNEITAQLSISQVNGKTLGANRDLIFNAQLNEGFDRAHWLLLGGDAPEFWVPEHAGHELAAGLCMAACHVSKLPLPFPVLRRGDTVDLNRSSSFAEKTAMDWASQQLQGYTVCLFIFRDSSLQRNLEDGLPTGFTFKVLLESD